jgi:hypothetical protein
MDLLLQAPVVVVADNKHQHLNPLLVQEEQMEQAHNRCCQHQEQAVAAAPVAPVAPEATGPSRHLRRVRIRITVAAVADQDTTLRE